MVTTTIERVFYNSPSVRCNIQDNTIHLQYFEGETVELYVQCAVGEEPSIKHQPQKDKGNH